MRMRMTHEDEDTPIGDEDTPAGNGTKHETGFRPVTAVLMLGGTRKQGDESREIFESVDFWVIATGDKIILKTPAYRILSARTKDELERRLEKKYPAPDGCTMLHYEKGRDVRTGKTRVEGWRSLKYEYTHELWTGWRVLKTPKYAGEIADITQLLHLCVRHKRILIPAATLARLNGTEDVCKPGPHEPLPCNSFIVSGTGSPDLKCVRWNPLQRAQRERKAKLAEVERCRQPYMPDDLLAQLGKALSPDSWSADHPYHLLRGPADTEKGGGWHAKSYETYAYTAEEVMTMARVNQLLTPTKRPWRASRDYKFWLRNCLEHVHGIRGSEDRAYRRLARWLTAEAKALRIALPSPPVKPGPVSKFKARRKRRRRLQYLTEALAWHSKQQVVIQAAAGRLSTSPDLKSSAALQAVPATGKA